MQQLYLQILIFLAIISFNNQGFITQSLKKTGFIKLSKT